MINSAINSADKFKDPKEILNTSGETIFPLFLLSIFQYCTETGKESLRFLGNIFFFTHHIFSSFNIYSFLVEMIKLCLPHALVPCKPAWPRPRFMSTLPFSLSSSVAPSPRDNKLLQSDCSREITRRYVIGR